MEISSREPSERLAWVTVQPPPGVEDVGVEVPVGPGVALVVGFVGDTDGLAPSEEVVLLDVEPEARTAAGDPRLAAELEGPAVVGFHHDLDAPFDLARRDDDRIDDAEGAEDARALGGGALGVRIALLEQQHRAQEILTADDVQGVGPAVEPGVGLGVGGVEDVEAVEGDGDDRQAVEGIVRGRAELRRENNGEHEKGDGSCSAGHRARRLRAASRSRTSSATWRMRFCSRDSLALAAFLPKPWNIWLTFNRSLR